MVLLVRYVSEISKHSTLATYVANGGRVFYLTKMTALRKNRIKGLKKIGITNDLFLMLSDGGIVHQKTAIELQKKLDKIPRRGRGFGQRHRAYREYKNSNKASETDTKILALLTTLVKQNQPTIDLSKPEERKKSLCAVHIIYLKNYLV